MFDRFIIKYIPVSSRCLTFLLLATAGFAQTEGGIMLRGGAIHPISGPVIEGGSVLIRDGKIVAVGRTITAPEGYQVIDIKGQHVYPGMIDAAAMLGLDGQGAGGDTQEVGLLNPHLRSITAVNPESEQIPFTRGNGVTSVITMPEGELLSGQMSLIHLDGSMNDKMAVTPLAAVHLRFPALSTRPVPAREHDHADDDPSQTEEIPYEVAKADYDRKMAALEALFDEAQRYARGKAANAPGLKPDLRLEAMVPVFERKTPLFVTAVREREIREAVEFAQRQKIRIILADAYESYKLAPLLKEHDIPVVLGPTFTLPLHPDDPYDLSYTIPGKLYEAGIRFAIASFSARQSHNLPYQAAAAVPFGLPQDAAYRAVSLGPAEIFGVGKMLGSIEEGKIADLIVTDGDPLEVTTKVNLVFIGGTPVSLDTRQKALYEKYVARPQ
jgi:imidazolonepropionase-like amidohydrolase